MHRPSLVTCVALAAFVVLGADCLSLPFPPLPPLSNGALESRAERQRSWLSGHVVHSRDKRDADDALPERRDSQEAGSNEDREGSDESDPSNSSNPSSSEEEDHICDTNYCSLTYSLYEMRIAILCFEFATLTQQLQGRCPVSEEMLANCQSRACRSTAMALSIVQYACNHRNQFFTSGPCWAGEFTHEMDKCVRNSPNESAVRVCASTRLGTLDGCTPDARQFFLQFFDYVTSTFQM